MKRCYVLLIFILGSCANTHGMGCGYVPAESPENPYPELTSSSGCGNLIDDDTLVLEKSMLSKLYFDSDGLAVIRFRGAIFYVTRSGKTAPTIYFDNGPDYFVQGLARTTKHHKIGFMDKRLNTVIPPAYDFASPFANGTAKVCNGCRKKYYGEHWEMQGGLWGEIDLHGNLIAPMRPKTNNH